MTLDIEREHFFFLFFGFIYFVPINDLLHFELKFMMIYNERNIFEAQIY